MSLQFDCNELFAEFNASHSSFAEIDEKVLYEIPQTLEPSNTEIIQDQSFNFFTLMNDDPKEDNHVWYDNHQEIFLIKQIHVSRKDTADHDQICNEENTLEIISKKRPIDPLKNQTKNIPKNFGKAIIAFVLKYKKITKNVLSKLKAGSYKDFIDFLEQNKKQITTIADFRSLWTDNPFQHVLRTLSCLFLRKYSLHYIFNSRINNYGSHIKYRQRFLEALKTPKDFKHIKEF